MSCRMIEDERNGRPTNTRAESDAKRRGPQAAAAHQPAANQPVAHRAVGLVDSAGYRHEAPQPPLLCRKIGAAMVQCVKRRGKPLAEL